MVMTGSTFSVSGIFDTNYIEFPVVCTKKYFNLLKNQNFICRKYDDVSELYQNGEKVKTIMTSNLKKHFKKLNEVRKQKFKKIIPKNETKRKNTNSSK